MQTAKRSIHVAQMPEIPPLEVPLDSWFADPANEKAFSDLYAKLLDVHKVCRIAVR